MATMKKSKVVEILTFYRNIDGEIRLYKSTVADLEAYYEPLSAQLDGMPRGKNSVSQPTETIALNLPDNLREDIEFYNSKISALYKLKTEILKEVSGLELKFKCIITDYYLHGLKWEHGSVKISETQPLKRWRPGLKTTRLLRILRSQHKDCPLLPVFSDIMASETKVESL